MYRNPVEARIGQDQYGQKGFLVALKRGFDCSNSVSIEHLFSSRSEPKLAPGASRCSRSQLFARRAGVHVDLNANRHFNDLRCFPSHFVLPNFATLLPYQNQAKPTSNIAQASVLQCHHRDHPFQRMGNAQVCSATNKRPRPGRHNLRKINPRDIGREDSLSYPRKRLLLQDHLCEWVDIGLQHHEQTDKTSQRDRVLEHEAQNRAFVSDPVGGGRGDDDRLRVDHLAHDAAG